MKKILLIIGLLFFCALIYPTSAYEIDCTEETGSTLEINTTIVFTGSMSVLLIAESGTSGMINTTMISGTVSNVTFVETGTVNLAARIFPYYPYDFPDDPAYEEYYVFNIVDTSGEVYLDIGQVPIDLNNEYTALLHGSLNYTDLIQIAYSAQKLENDNITVDSTYSTDYTIYWREHPVGWEGAGDTDWYFDKYLYGNYSDGIVNSSDVYIADFIGYEPGYYNISCFLYYDLDDDSVPDTTEEYYASQYVTSTGAERIDIGVYARSDQDNSILGGATIEFDDLFDDVVNQTLSSGYAVFELQPDHPYIVDGYLQNYTFSEYNSNPVTFSSEQYYSVYFTPEGTLTGNNTGLVNFYISDEDGNRIASAYITIVSDAGTEVKISSTAGYAQYEMIKNTSLSYTVTKSGYESYSRTFTPSWTGDSITETVTLTSTGGGTGVNVTATATPDERTNVDKAEDAFSIVLDYIEVFASLLVIVLLFSFMRWINGPSSGGRRRR